MNARGFNVLFVGAASNVLSMLVQVASVFVLTPVILRSLGNYDYGIWEMLGSVVGYMGLMQVGFQPTVSRYTAKLNASGTVEELRRLIATALVFLVAIGVVGLVVFSAWALLYPELLAPTGADPERYAIVLALFGLQFAISMPGNIQESLLEGLQLYGWKNLTTICTKIVSTAVAYVWITKFDPMIFLAVLGLVMLLIKQGIWHLILRRARPGILCLSVARASRQTFAEIFRFSAKTFIQGLGSNIERNSPALIIGWLLGPASVVFYRLPLALIGYINTFSMHLSHAFMPFFSELQALGQTERMRNIYLRSSKVLVAIVAPAGLLAALLGPEFIGRWAGQQYVEGTRLVLPIIAATQFVSSINPLSSRFLTAANRHGFLAKLALPIALLGVGLGIAMAMRWGTVGVALGAFLPLFIKEPLILRYTSAQLGISGWAYLRRTVLALFPALICTAIVVEALKESTALTTYTGIILAAVAGGLTYVGVVLLTGFNQDERRDLVRVVARLSPRWVR